MWVSEHGPEAGWGRTHREVRECVVGETETCWGPGLKELRWPVRRWGT